VQSNVIFNFTEVYDTDSRVGRYQWGIGSAPGLVDVVPLRDYEGDFKPRDIKLPSGGYVPIRVPQVVSAGILGSKPLDCMCLLAEITWAGCKYVVTRQVAVILPFLITFFPRCVGTQAVIKRSLLCKSAVYCLQAASIAPAVLAEGPNYYITVVAWNQAGPPLAMNFSSSAVQLDMTGPIPGAVYNT
jgi:hypothetical protein